MVDLPEVYPLNGSEYRFGSEPDISQAIGEAGDQVSEPNSKACVRLTKLRNVI